MSRDESFKGIMLVFVENHFKPERFMDPLRVLQVAVIPTGFKSKSFVDIKKMMKPITRVKNSKMTGSEGKSNEKITEFETKMQ